MANRNNLDTEDFIYCEVCGLVDSHYDEDGTDEDRDFETVHYASRKHKFNQILEKYKTEKKNFTYIDNIKISAIITISTHDGEILSTVTKEVLKKVSKLRINTKPREIVKLSFGIKNDCNDDVLVVGVDVGHPQPQFQMNDHGFYFGQDMYEMPRNTSVPREVSVTFSAIDIGRYEMPVFFIFKKAKSNRPLIGVCDMLIFVQEHNIDNEKIKSPFTGEFWPKVNDFVYCTKGQINYQYKVPKPYKAIFPRWLKDENLERINLPQDVINQYREIMRDIRAIFEDVDDNGLNINNYINFFHYLLWWEEVIQSINLKKYNMAKVNITFVKNVYKIKVPGLAEKRPSLLRGDRVYLRPCINNDIIFESVIKDIEDDVICLSDLDPSFQIFYSPFAEFSVRFILSRVTFERKHQAVDRLIESKQECRVFPLATARSIPIKEINRFYNPQIQDNEEQKMAVKSIVSGTSGKAPYMVFGPPGTGKTITIVEAIVQLVVRNAKNRVLVCTDSNMAADHVACMLLHYKETLKIENFLLRANSQNRVWEVMPPALRSVSNGDSYESYVPIDNQTLSKYRVVVATLLHTAKFASTTKGPKKHITHLFIDEAAQAQEPACLVPITVLLSPQGQLILAGDPKQLGPVCVCKEAGKRGLGTSLMERLLNDYENLYNEANTGTNYITMLKNNFRSHRDILDIPNDLFYKNELKYLAPEDPLSKVDILGEGGGNAAIVFHSVNSKEQRDGKSPSYFNLKELEMLQRYITKMIRIHNVLPKDIGVIAPYVRQVYKIRSWLKNENYDEVEVGTVEAFQGKEKRVILVTTVRANSNLLDYDAKYGLGFLVDDKRFNVTLTRAKAKAVIIGNAPCLKRDLKWRIYMNKCQGHDTYFGEETEQLPRNVQLLDLIVNKNFNKYGLFSVLNEKVSEQQSYE